MIILIDSGNSRVKLGWIDPQNAATPREPVTAAFDNLGLDALADWIRALPTAPSLALGVNVAGDRQAAAIAATLERHGCDLRWVRAQAQTLGLANRYKEPAQLGPDRWVSMLGVLGRLPARHPPFVLACFGTATTIDTVGADNVFAGGLILPGPAMMRSSLVAGTANLPLADGLPVDYPTDTHAAIVSGIAAAQAGAVVRQWLAGHRLYGQAPDIYVAGGGWPDIATETQRLLAEAGAALGMAPTPIRVDNPVLDGLAILATQADPQAF